MRNKHGSMSLFLRFSIGRKVNARGSAFARTLPFPPCLALYLLAWKTHMKKSVNAEFFPRYVWHESIRLSNRVLLLNCGTIFSFLSCKAFVLFLLTCNVWRFARYAFKQRRYCQKLCLLLYIKEIWIFYFKFVNFKLIIVVKKSAYVNI